MNEFFTWEMIATFGGMLALVSAVTQIVKYYVSVDPKWIALGTAIIGQLAVQFLFYKDFSVGGIVMALINVVAVLAGSITLFEVAIKPIQKKIENS